MGVAHIVQIQILVPGGWGRHRCNPGLQNKPSLLARWSSCGHFQPLPWGRPGCPPPCQGLVVVELLPGSSCTCWPEVCSYWLGGSAPAQPSTLNVVDVITFVKTCVGVRMAPLVDLVRFPDPLVNQLSWGTWLLLTYILLRPSDTTTLWLVPKTTDRPQTTDTDHSVLTMNHWPLSNKMLSKQLTHIYQKKHLPFFTIMRQTHKDQKENTRVWPDQKYKAWFK